MVTVSVMKELMILVLQSKWITRIIMVLRQVNLQVRHYFIKAFKLSAKEDIKWVAFIWGNVVYLSDYINCTKRLRNIRFEQMFLPWCEMNFGFSTWRYWMLNIFLIHFRKLSLHFNISNETSNFTSFRVKLSTIKTTCTFEEITKSIARESNSLTRRQSLRINFWIKSVTLGPNGSAIPAALPVLW